MKLKLFKQKNKRLEKQLEDSIIFDMMINLAEKEYKIDIKKNTSSKSLIPTQKKGKKA